MRKIKRILSSLFLFGIVFSASCADVAGMVENASTNTTAQLAIIKGTGYTGGSSDSGGGGGGGDSPSGGQPSAGDPGGPTTDGAAEIEAIKQNARDEITETVSEAETVLESAETKVEEIKTDKSVADNNKSRFTRAKEKFSELKNKANDYFDKRKKVSDPGTGDVDSADSVTKADDAKTSGKEAADEANAGTDSNIAENTELENSDSSETAGDPISVASGEYILQDSDIKNVTRCYTSQNNITGSFGYGWYSNLDEVILVGSDNYTENPKPIYDKKCVDVIYTEISDLEDKIISEYNVSSVGAARNELLSSLNQFKTLRENINSAKTSAEEFIKELDGCSVYDEAVAVKDSLSAMITDCETELENCNAQLSELDGIQNYEHLLAGEDEYLDQSDLKGKINALIEKINDLKSDIETSESDVDDIIEESESVSYSDEAESVKNDLQDLLDDCDTQIAAYEAQLSSIETDIANLNLLKSEYQTALKISAEYGRRYEENKTYENRNNAAKKSGMADFYHKTGQGTYTYVDEKALPHIFIKSKTNANIYVPLSESQHEFISLSVSGGRYELLLKDGRKKVFSSNGLLMQIIDRNGNSVTINRNSNGKVSSVRTTFGENYIFTYDGDFISRITKERNANFKIIYTYSKNTSSGKTYLSSVTDEDGDKVTFEYDNSGRLIKINKNDGSKIQVVYNTVLSDGTILATSTTNEQGYSENFVYNKSAKKTTYTDHDGNKTEYQYDGSQRTIYQKNPDGTEIYFSYDSSGNCTKETVNGNTTSYSYDSLGNRTRADYSDGSYETWSYDSYSLLLSHRDRDGITETYYRDTKGNLVKYIRGGKTVLSAKYDSKGQITEQIVYGGAEIKTTFVYDAYGNVVEKKTGDQKQNFVYDSDDRVTKITVNNKVISSYEYKNHTATKTDYNGKKTVYTWNGRKDLIRIEEIDTKTGEKRVTRYEYDRRHLPVREYSGGASEQTLGWEGRYTPAGLPLAEMIIDNNESYVTLYSYSGSAINSITSFKYGGKITNFQTVNLADLQKKAVDVRVQKYDRTIEYNNKLTVKFTDELGRVQIFKYDSFGNNYEYINPRSEKFTNSFSAGGRVKSMQSEYGGFYDLQYDSQGSIAGAGEKGKGKNSVARNNDGSISSVTNRYGEKTIYSYNAYGKVRSVSSPAKTAWYSYDGFGQLVRLVVGYENNPATSEMYVEYSYSDDGRRVTVNEGGLYKTTFELNAFGEIIKRTDGNGHSCEFEYDEYGNRTSFIDGYGNRATFEYNRLGLVSKVTDFCGGEKRYFYDSAFNLVKVTDALGVIWQGIYDKGGRLISEKGRPGIDKSYAYDELDRLKSVTTGGVITESYSYSQCGNEKDYHYYNDDFGRTVSEKNRAGDYQNYSFDAEGALKLKKDFNGNETKVSTERKNGRTKTTYSFYDSTDSVFEYDMSGNVVRAVNETAEILYEYDKGGKLVSSTDKTGGDTIKYEYDNAGNKTHMTSNSSDIFYVYGKNNELLLMYDEKQRTSVKFSYDKCGREISRTFGNGCSQTTSYDEAGRVILISEKNANGSLVRAEGYVYDSDGRQSARVNEKGAVTMFEYDKQGHVSKVFYPLSKELEEHQKREAEENGLYTENAVVGESRYLSSGLYTSLNALLVKMRGTVYTVTPMQAFNVEKYEYDRGNNLVSKTTSYGTIEYKYDAENRLVSSGAKGNARNVSYKYDNNGNLLEENSVNMRKKFVYNASGRMRYSQMIDEREMTASHIVYDYDAFGRRTVVQDSASSAMRTLYDGLTFDVVKKSPTHPNGRYVDTFYDGTQNFPSEKLGESSPTDRYYYIDENASQNDRVWRRFSDDSSYKIISENDGAERVFMSLNGSPVVISQINDAAQKSRGTYYFGTDLYGSIRSETDAYGELRGVYDYDVSGSGLFSNGSGYGYCGKSYSPATKLLDYGYRDYNPRLGRFTTLDPIRDGVNWFGYCGGDSVNWVDRWGLKVRNPGTTLQNSSTAILGMQETGSTIYDAGCVLTSYYRIATALGYTGDLESANDYAKEHNLFTNNDELTQEAGAELINGLVNDTSKHIEYDSSVSGSTDNMAATLLMREGAEGEFFVTLRMKTCNADKSKIYEHTLSIGEDAIFLEEQPALLDNMYGFKYIDTSSVDRKGTNDNGRINEPLRLDFFKIVPQEINDAIKKEGK